MRRISVRVRGSWLLLTLATLGCLFVFGGTAVALTGDDTPTLTAGVPKDAGDEEAEQQLRELDFSITSAMLAGDTPLDIGQAATLRVRGQGVGKKLGLAKGSDPSTFSGSWRSLGPNPVVQVQRGDSAFAAVSGRIGALAIEPNGRFILGAASGGIWTMDNGTTVGANGTWVPRTSDQDTQTIGAITIAPSNANIVYAGTGEGALSGDSVYGDGILKSTDGGTTWSHVSGDYFVGVSISRVVVDPTNANHLYVAVLRGRSGERRVSVATHSRFGIWESTDGGQTFNLLREVPEGNGATDLEMDPQNPSVMYASFWGDAMYKSTDAGHTWTKIMNGLPAGAHYDTAGTRFSIAISHPPNSPAVLYSGFDWNNADGSYHKPEVWKSVDAGANWAQLPGVGPTRADSVENYCATAGSQCSYDNVIETDPTNPNVVYAGGSYGYDLSPQSGGIYRSTDGGQTWLNLGWDLHPDFHALAMDPTNPDHVLIGNDGGVWYSADRGGRPSITQPLNAVDWQNLNGTVNPATAAVIHRTGLDIAQYSSLEIAQSVPAGADSPRFWGGTQDNGTQRKSANSATWFDEAGGDGGQVLVDPSTDASNNSCALGACFEYGTFNGFKGGLYRISDGGAVFFSRQIIQSGLNADRSEFYIPWVLNPNNPNQLLAGSYRMYRTDDARGSAKWNLISPDLTTGCTGTAPNGARTCAISAIGVGGGTGAYVGTLDGNVWVSPDAQTAATPTWTQIDTKTNHLPNRPVSDLAVDRSNYRIAYLAYNGYDEATPKTPGHAFATTDGGKSWKNITGNLPDVPLNSLILDPSYPNTLYAGTQVGAFVTHDGGVHWGVLGVGIPNVSVWQLDLDPGRRILAAGTHGRGAYMVTDSTGNAAPALVLSKVDAGVPVGPASNLQYTITLKNIGNLAATGVTITDPIPGYTSFVSADNGGTFSKGTVTWSGLGVPAGGSVSVKLTVSIADALKAKVSAITNDGMKATANGGFSVTGSPVVTTIAPAFAMSAAPAAQTGAAHAGSSVDYTVGITNLGYTTDTYALSSSGGTFPVTFLDASCTNPMTTTPSVSAGATTNVCVRVSVPNAAADGANDTSTIKATSVGSSSVSASVTVTTVAVTKDTLLVDEDGNDPDVQSYYATALTANGVDFTPWDLNANPTLPIGFLNAYKNVYWFTGNSYPAPITPYEPQLKSFLDGGGHLFMSGQDILDQSAGTTAFVQDYLHIDWDGTDRQNDQETADVNGVNGSPLTDGVGAVPLDHSVLGAAFEDQITPNGTAAPAFTDDTGATDGLSFSDGYKVVFLAFPFEAYGSAADKADLVARVQTFFGP
ncbi:MAG: hypothetical protein ACTHKS_09710 [Gaiellaceae bacterium]